MRRHSGDNIENKEKNAARKRNYSGEEKSQGLYPGLPPHNSPGTIPKQIHGKTAKDDSLSEIISLCKLFNSSITTLTKENKTRDEGLSKAFGQQQQQLTTITEQLLHNQGKTEGLEQELLRMRQTANDSLINNTIPILSTTHLNNTRNTNGRQGSEMKNKLNDGLKLIKTFDGTDGSSWLNHRQKIENVI